MEISTLILQIGISLAAMLAVVCLFGLFEHQISEILKTFFLLLHEPFLKIRDSLDSFWQGVGNFYRAQFAGKAGLDLQQVFYKFIGAMLYSIFFVAFNFSELHLLSLSLEATGIHGGYFNLPFGVGALIAFTLIASFLFWGAIVLDLLGVTNTAPWKEALNQKWTGYLLYVALFCLALSLFVTCSMGLFRGKVIVDESLNASDYALSFDSGLSDAKTGFNPNSLALSGPVTSGSSGGVYYWIPIIANVCIPVLVGIGGVFAGWGVVTLIKFIMLAAGFLIISPLGVLFLASTLLVIIIDRLYLFINAIFNLSSSMGNSFMGLFGWNPPDSQQAGNQNCADNCQEKDGIDNHSDNQGSPEVTQNEDIKGSPEDGWDPYKKQGG